MVGRWSSIIELPLDSHMAWVMLLGFDGSSIEYFNNPKTMVIFVKLYAAVENSYSVV